MGMLVTVKSYLLKGLENKIINLLTKRIKQVFSCGVKV